MILTMFVLDSPAISSDTACLIAMWLSRRLIFGKISPHELQEKISFRRGLMILSEYEISNSGCWIRVSGSGWFVVSG